MLLTALPCLPCAEIRFACAQSLESYSSERFSVGLRISVKELHQHPLLGSMPLDLVFPESLTFPRLEKLGINSLVIWGGTPHEPLSTNEIEWAVVASLKNPVEPIDCLQEWNHSFPFSLPIVPAKSIEIAGAACLQVPAGKVIPIWNPPLDLSFTNRAGENVESGIHVGKLDETRGFIEGASSCSIIYRLKDIDESRLQGESLVLQLRSELFKTRKIESSFARATVELRNPVSRLTSLPIAFDVKSHVDQELTVARQLKVRDSDGVREADLVRDLVENGEVEVVIRLKDFATYLGMGPQDLRVKPQRFDYLFTNGNLLIATQSKEAMVELLRRDDTNIGSKLASIKGELVFASQVRNQRDRKMLRHMAELLGESDWLTHWARTSVESKLQLAISEDRVTGTVRYVDATNCSFSSGLFSRMWRNTEAFMMQEIRHKIDLLDARGSLFDLLFEWGNTWPHGLRMSLAVGDSAESDKRVPALLRAIKKAVDRSFARETKGQLELEIHWPTEEELSAQSAERALACLEQSYALDLKGRGDFEQSADFLSRAIKRVPDAIEMRFFRAYEFAYNFSNDFEGHEIKYKWIRRAILSLLDEADRSSQKVDYLTMAAHFISRKIGVFDETQGELQKLFAGDNELQSRFGEYIGERVLKNVSEPANCWTVAMSLLDFVDESRSTDSKCPEYFYRVERIFLSGHFAQSKSQEGNSVEAEEAWKTTLQRCRDLANQGLEIPEQGNVMLPEQPSVADLVRSDILNERRTESDLVLETYAYWRLRAEFELLEEIQGARKLVFQAAAALQRGDKTGAVKLFEDVLQLVSSAFADNAELVETFAITFEDAANEYQRLREDEWEIPAGIVQVLEAIELQKLRR